MAKKTFLDQTGLEELVKHIPQIVAGTNITLTPDADKPNKITISCDGASTINYASSTDIDLIFD